MPGEGKEGFSTTEPCLEDSVCAKQREGTAALYQPGPAILAKYGPQAENHLLSRLRLDGVVGGTNRELGVLWGTQAAVIPKWSCAPEELCHYLSGHGSPQKMSGTFSRCQRQTVSGHPTVPANSSSPSLARDSFLCPKHGCSCSRGTDDNREVGHLCVCVRRTDSLVV